eukprot:02544.XXX_41289_41441_1 [CDS] Oithona nana genome sequencing.
MLSPNSFGTTFLYISIMTKIQVLPVRQARPPNVDLRKASDVANSSLSSSK